MLRPDAAAKLLRAHGSGVLVLTGAGVSTASGIPDYRGPSGDPRGYKAPITAQVFNGSDAARRRYWARSIPGFRALSEAKPNAFHHAIAQLQAHGLLGEVITQNVDRLHHKAGSENTLELHGRVDIVECSRGCPESTMKRTVFHAILEERNPTMASLKSAQLRPDGDADIDGSIDLNTFVVPDCTTCGAYLRPKVVFFGGSLDPQVKAQAEALAFQCKGLLVFGTTLEAYSAFRLVRLAHQAGAPVGIVNRGPTRGDSLASLGRNSDSEGVVGFAVQLLSEAVG